MLSERCFEVKVNTIIDSLYRRVEPSELVVSHRTSADYRRILNLKEIPLNPDARVLDIGTGKAPIKAADFSLSPGNLIRSDIHPQEEGIHKENVLGLSFSNNEFDEVWSVYSLRYIDSELPILQDSLLETIISESGIDYRSAAEAIPRFEVFLGLRALGEMFRVTKPEGRIRIGSLVLDFVREGAINALLTAIDKGKIPGVAIESKGITSMDGRPNERDAYIVFRKGIEYSPINFNTYHQSFYQAFIPEEFVEALIKR